MNAVEPGEVRAHVDRLSASRVFAESDRMRRFLRFTVESRLNGQHDRVKEYVLGREVFDRIDGYDPRLDPIVRVEARRLRSKLDEYYSGPGHAEEIRIEYPKGGYLPVFTRVKPGSMRWLSGKGRLLWACAAAVCALLIAAGAYRFAARTATNDMIAVMPLAWVEPYAGDLEPADADLSQAVTGAIANRRALKVLAWPIVQQYKGRFTSFHDVGSALGVSKLLVLVIRRQSSATFLNAFLIDPKTGEKLRMLHYFAPAIGTSAEQDTVARKIASDLARGQR